MKALRSTLTFVLGLFLGIIMLIVAIVGVVLGIGTTMTVKDIGDKTGIDIVGEDSALYSQTLLDAIKSVLGDIQNFDTLSLKDLYDHYGISLFKEMSDLDLSQKEFYTIALMDIVDDWSLLTNSITLDDVGTIAKFDFTKYDLPILEDNLQNNINSALDNILNSLNDDLSIRAIKDRFGIDLGAADNAMLGKLQDLKLSQFGSVIDVLTVDTLLAADADTFVPEGTHAVYHKADRYEEVPAAQLSSTTATVGAETYIAGGIDTDEDGKFDKADVRELRYILKDGEYVVDNTCYNEEHADVTYYRHLLYEKATAAGAENYIVAYANRIATIEGQSFTLVEKGFVSIDNLYNRTNAGATRTRVVDTMKNGSVVIGSGMIEERIEGDSYNDCGYFTMNTEDMDKDSRLTAIEGERNEVATGTTVYRRIHTGTANPVLQMINYFTIGELQDADDVIKNAKIGDIIDVDAPDASKVLKALRNSTLDTIGSDIKYVILDDMMDIVKYEYDPDPNGMYVKIVDGESFYYTLYNPALHAGLDRYTRKPLDKDPSEYSSKVLQRFAGATLDSLSTAFDDLLLSDVLDIMPDTYKAADPELLEKFKSTETTDPEVIAAQKQRIYYFDANTMLYKVVTPEKMRELDASPEPPEYLVIDKQSEDVAVLKKLAFVKVNDLATAMDTVMEELFIDELIDIVKYYQVEKGEGEVEQYLVEWDNKTVIDKGGNTVERAGGDDPVLSDDTPIVYVLNAGISGPFIHRDYKYVELDNSETAGSQFGVSATPFYYEYKPANTKELVNEKFLTGNLFYKNDAGTYIYNQQLIGYFYFQANKESGNEALLNKLYYCEESEGPTDNIGYKYACTEKHRLYVDLLGTATEYNKDNLMHWFLNKYYKQDGSYFVDKNDSMYAFEAGKDLTYAQKFCEDIYVKAVDGEYVYVNGAYIAYDASAHEGLDRYNKVIGYIAEKTEVNYYDTNSSGYKPMEFGTFYRVNVTQTKSSLVLQYLADSTVNTMSDSIDKATLSDIIDITPDSIFNNESLRNAKLTEIAEKMEYTFTSMTLGQLFTVANITDVAPQVRDALVDMTIPQFFSCLKYDPEMGIYVDILSYLDAAPVETP